MNGTPARSAISSSLTGSASESGTPHTPSQPLEGRQSQVRQDVLDISCVDVVLSRDAFCQIAPVPACRGNHVATAFARGPASESNGNALRTRLSITEMP